MHVEFDLPQAPDIRLAISEFWNRYLFVGSPSHIYQVNALATTFMRLADAAIEEYALGATALRQFWELDRNGLNLLLMHRAIFHFESSLTATHRAIATFRRLRNNRTADTLVMHTRALKPKFVSDEIADRFREPRDVIQHFSEKLVNGQVTEGHPVALQPDGPETAHPSLPGQTVKTIDRMIVGPHQLLFTDLVATLREMVDAASHIARFPDRSPLPEGAA